MSTERSTDSVRAGDRSEGPDSGQGLVLVVDDDPAVVEVLSRWLQKEGHQVETFLNGETCLAALTRTMPDAVCLDLDMPGMGGLKTLERIKAHHRHLPVIILTADASVESVVSAMQRGAYDYLTKPVDFANLITRIRNAVERYRMSTRLTQLEREAQGLGYPRILGSSPAMREVYRQIDLVSASDITVLIHGESGTGKELVARSIHENSGRKKGPFVALNCAAVPESLQESELFGHEKGAFTGAIERRAGRFEQANRGTLFLDEVAELSPALQAKLLRVLEEQSFQRVGGSTEVRSDFRLLAATHRQLAEEVKAVRFREDLFYRIAVFELQLPPLRERDGDILLLASAFVEEFTQERKTLGQLSPPAAKALLAYDWPGNVRELRNVIQRAVVVSGGESVLPQHLPEKVQAAAQAVAGSPPETGREGGAQPLFQQLGMALPGVAPPPNASSRLESAPAETRPETLPSLNLEELERRAIVEALRKTEGNLTQVVKLLGIGRTTLYRKLKRYKLD
jgi:two-component system response regulator HydG